jgi:cytochrome c553
LEIINLLKVIFIKISNLGEVMKSKLVLLLIVFSFMFTNSIFADQKQLVGADADYGEHLFGECVTCHNSTGLGQGIPKITGMKTNQFITKILAYKTKEKENAVMQMVAERLGEEEINSLALYLSKLK